MLLDFCSGGKRQSPWAITASRVGEGGGKRMLEKGSFDSNLAGLEGRREARSL